MSDLKKKTEKYEEILQDLCARDEDIDHAVLITAYPSEGGGKRFKCVLNTYKADTDTTATILKQVLSQLGWLDEDSDDERLH